MTLFDNISKRLFSSEKNFSVHEVLERPSKFIEDYNTWKDNPMFVVLKQDMLKTWHFQKMNEHSAVDMVLYTSDYANGFIVYPKYQDSIIPLSFLMEYLKNQMVYLSYRLAHSDRRIKEISEHIETLEKYYLKPPSSKIYPKDQLYGNVVIELAKHDKNEIHLKFLASIYSDHTYSKHRDFNELISILFDS